MRWVRLVLSWTLFLGSLIGYPVAAWTFAKDEPPVVLFLSFLAITLEGFNGVQIAHDSKEKK